MAKSIFLKCCTLVQGYVAFVFLPESVRMSSWKLQMAAVVIVRTELNICKLYTSLFSDFSTGLLLWCDAITSYNSARHVLCTFLSVLSVFLVFYVCHANGVSWSYRMSFRLFWTVSMGIRSDVLWPYVWKWKQHKVH